VISPVLAGNMRSTQIGLEKLRKEVRGGVGDLAGDWQLRLEIKLEI
jgi:hypothetical protein